jgi:hypothetical protein
MKYGDDAALKKRYFMHQQEFGSKRTESPSNIK